MHKTIVNPVLRGGSEHFRLSDSVQTMSYPQGRIALAAFPLLQLTQTLKAIATDFGFVYSTRVSYIAFINLCPDLPPPI